MTKIKGGNWLEAGPPVNGGHTASDSIELERTARSKEAAPQDEPYFATVTEAEEQQEKLPYPKSVFFIVSNEFCERFNYYGMRTVLVLYLSRQLGYNEDLASIIFHIFTMFVYFLCVFGAIVSDSWLGKFKTILNLSIVYICGSILLTLGSIGTLNVPTVTFTMLGLGLIALGSGGIKPCVAAFGGDQFKLPEQAVAIKSFFSLFYFAINAGSLISTTVTPILREDVSCFGQKECYPLAFGVPAVLMGVSIVIFVLGRPLYKTKPPAGNMVVLVTKTIAHAISQRCKERKRTPRAHWLDYADQQYDKQLIDDVKVLMRILVLYLPLPLFWALFDQQGSRWTFQATRMDGDLGAGWTIKPDQLQVLNPLLILGFIPLYELIFYPALKLIGIRRPLQKLTMGGILAGIAFVMSGIVELHLQQTYPDLPTATSSQLRVFNTEPCAIDFNTQLSNLKGFTVPSGGYYVNNNIPNMEGAINITYDIKSACLNTTGAFTLNSQTAVVAVVNSRNSTPSTSVFTDFVDKSSDSRPLVRTMVQPAPGVELSTLRVEWRAANDELTTEASQAELLKFTAAEYQLSINGNTVAGAKQHFRVGGVYAVVVQPSKDVAAAGAYVAHVYEIVAPNSMHILWLTPQYVVMTLGEVMFSVTGLEFSYAQAPLAMKSVLQACWLLAVAIGNLIVVIIAEAAFFESRASEFFLFAGLMFIDMVIFMFLAYSYKPNDPMANVPTHKKNGKSVN